MTADEYKQEFRERLKMARLRMNLTLAEVADEIGVTKQAIHVWETGKSWPSPRMRRRIVRWLVEVDAELERRK